MAMMIIMFSPVFALVLFWVLPFWTALPIYIPIFIFGFIVNVKMMKSMRLRVKTGSEGMIGKEAEVIEDIDPEGKVRVEDEIWAATGKGKRFDAGKKVKVVGVRGLVLIVEDSEFDATSKRVRRG
jgi:membrane-bound ClpP family serine protease